MMANNDKHEAAGILESRSPKKPRVGTVLDIIETVFSNTSTKYKGKTGKMLPAMNREIDPESDENMFMFPSEDLEN